MGLRDKSQNGKIACVLGGTGFIGHHLARRLMSEGYGVRVVDIQPNQFGEQNYAHEYLQLDLTDPKKCLEALTTNNIYEQWDEVYALAADMGGAGYIFTKEHDADLMHNSALININVLHLHKKYKKIFYSSSACMYPEHNQLDPNNPNCSEESAYPAAPDSEYGWEKLFSERLYLAYNRNYGVDVRIARFHNIFGPECTWDGGKEKSPAALCRKILMAPQDGTIEVWGDGEQTRSFLYIDECLEGVRRLMESDFKGPVNIGSEEMISINNFVEMISDIENKNISIKHIEGPLGVRGRNSCNKLIKEKLGWEPTMSLREGIEKTYYWIKSQISS